MKPLKLRVSLTLDEPLVEELREIAERQDRSLSSYINIVMRDHLEQIKKAKEK